MPREIKPTTSADVAKELACSRFFQIGDWEKLWLPDCIGARPAATPEGEAQRYEFIFPAPMGRVVSEPYREGDLGELAYLALEALRFEGAPNAFPGGRILTLLVTDLSGSTGQWSVRDPVMISDGTEVEFTEASATAEAERGAASQVLTDSSGWYPDHSDLPASLQIKTPEAVSASSLTELSLHFNGASSCTIEVFLGSIMVFKGTLPGQYGKRVDLLTL